MFEVNHSSPWNSRAFRHASRPRGLRGQWGVFSRLPAFFYWLRMSGAVFVEKAAAGAEMTAFRLIGSAPAAGKGWSVSEALFKGEGPGRVQARRCHSALLAKVPSCPCASGAPGGDAVGSLRFKRRERSRDRIRRAIDGGIPRRTSAGTSTRWSRRILSMKG
jgi:hypothetical protein